MTVAGRTYADIAGEMILAAMAGPADSPCLIWPFYADNKGYGRFVKDGVSYAVHRLSCAAKHGEAPQGKPFALHTCNNGHKGCFHPHHLRWGSHQDNMADMVASGRSTFGESCPSAKLTEQQVLQIRELQGLERQCDLAQHFGVSARTIGKIHRREIWAHLNP